MKKVSDAGCRLSALKALAEVLAGSIDTCEDARALPPLAKQYRETIREIEEIEGGETDADEIGTLLAQRSADGKPGAVRKNRAARPDV